MKKPYHGSCHCGAVKLEGLDPRQRVDAPARYFDMLHDDPKSTQAETRHL